jgi:hypothetical protein
VDLTPRDAMRRAALAGGALLLSGAARLLEAAVDRSP